MTIINIKIETNGIFYYKVKSTMNNLCMCRMRTQGCVMGTKSHWDSL